MKYLYGVRQFFSSDVFAIDLRALAAFRILVGLNVIYNLLVYRIPFIEQFHINDSILSEEFIGQLYGNLFSVLNILNNPTAILFYFIFVLVLGILYTIGCQTKIVSVLLFFSFSTILSDNPFVVHAVEFLMEVSIFWSIFLPLDSRLSVTGNKGRKENKIASFATFTMLFQIFLIYFCGFVTKTGNYWTEGMMVEALTDDRMHAVLLAGWMKGMPGLAQLMTHSAVVLELVIALLIFSPWRKSASRFLSAVLVILLHFSLALMLNVGPFYMITTAFAIILLPAFVWDRIAIFNKTKKKKKAKTKKQKLVEKTAIEKYGRVIRLTVMITILLIVVQKNLQLWGKHGYGGDVLKKIPLIGQIAEIEIPRPGTFFGIFDQSWQFFAPNPVKDMGCFLIVGMTGPNQFTNLLTNEPIVIGKNAQTGEPEFNVEPFNDFESARFVFAFYSRRYLKYLPQGVFEKWTKYEVNCWKADNPGKRLAGAKLLYYSNETQLENGQLNRQKSLIEVFTLNQ